MLKYLPLLWANLQRKRLRTGLTLASIVIAFLLYGVLQTLGVALTGSAEAAGIDRLVTVHKVSIIQPLPQSYLNRIRSVPGVRVACSQDWFGGIYQNDRNQVGTIAVDPASFFEIYPEYALPEEQRRAWRADRTGAIVGKLIAARFQWKVGDTIPMRSNIYTQANGSNVWNLKVAGIYDAANGDNSGVYFHYDYFNESRSFGKDSIGWVVMRIADPDRAPQIARTIDAMFANSSTETKTSTERAFAQGFVNQMGNIGAIVTAVATAVFFTMLLVTANTMAQSVRERTNEIAVMKTLGFSGGSITTLVMAEALLLTLLGAAIGLVLSALLSNGIREAMQQFFPTLGVPASAYLTGALIAIALGVISGVLPCIQAGQLKIVDALRKN